jgi:hypothetical protein
MAFRCLRFSRSALTGWSVGIEFLKELNSRLIISMLCSCTAEWWLPCFGALRPAADTVRYLLQIQTFNSGSWLITPASMEFPRASLMSQSLSDSSKPSTRAKSSAWLDFSNCVCRIFYGLRSVETISGYLSLLKRRFGTLTGPGPYGYGASCKKCEINSRWTYWPTLQRVAQTFTGELRTACERPDFLRPSRNCALVPRRPSVQGDRSQ